MPSLLLIIFLYLPLSLVGLTIMLFILSRQLSRLEFYARLLASYLSLIFCASYGVLASLVLRLVGKHRVSQWATARSFKWVMRLTTGVRFEIEDEGRAYLNERPVVFVGNHQTELDILMLGTIFPPYCSVTAKSSLKHLPFLGWFMALSGTVFIDRTNRSSAITAFDSAATEMLTHRQSVFIFPEGTRSYSASPTLLPFKKGAFHLAVKAQVPVVPLVAANYANVLSVRERRFQGGRVPVRVLEPVETKGLGPADVEALMEDVRSRMLDALMDVSNGTKGKDVKGVVGKTSGAEVR
ncbi:MAG: 1-acyl-sn-glycerol-3-phosphate acyltransferase beta [Vezdaea aestivalis]|nr:MAG: 1-acyl-sn-glycerol-3-phosphate acyltransferase beta [Vezdaea aestivalis]